MKRHVRIAGLGLLVWSAAGCLPELRVIRGCRDGSLCDVVRDHAEVGEETAGEDHAEVMDAGAVEVGEVGGSDVVDAGAMDAGGMDAGDEVGAEAGADAGMGAMDVGVMCSAGLSECEGRCVSLRDDVRNCGACGTACATPDGGTVGCVEGRCVPMCGAGMAVVGGACVVIRAPRPVAPLSTATVTSHRPTLRWALGEGTDGARVELCRERACTTVVTTLDASGTSVRPTTDLTPGVWFWRLRGRVGGANGTVLGPTWQFNVGARSAPVDTSWGHASDFNGDGYADLLVGDGDTVRYYQGSASGIRTGSYTTLRYGSSTDSVERLTSAGDLNGDGFSDIVLGRQGTSAICIFWGSASGPSTTPGIVIPLDGVLLRVGVDGVGDFDGDGFGDIAAFGSEVNEGAIYFGSVSGPTFLARRVISDQDCVAVGDLNGDGFAEVATYNNAVGTSIVYGAPRSRVTFPVVSLANTAPDVYAGAGDFNGDGYSDVVLGAGTFPDRKRIYLGSASGMLVPGWNAASGQEVRPLGDTNGDGFADLGVLSPTTTEMTVYTGTSGGNPSMLGSVLFSRSDGFGQTDLGGRGVVVLGDVNGDVYTEVAISAAGTSSVYIFHGRPVGFPPVPTITLTEPGRRGFGGIIAALSPNPRQAGTAENRTSETSRCTASCIL